MRSCSRRSKPNPAQKRREEKRRAMAEEDDLEQMVERERKPAELPLLLRFLCWSVTTLNKLGRTRDGRYRRRMTDLLEFKVKANTKPKNGVYTKDVTVDASINLWVRLFVPVEAHSSTESFPAMIDRASSLRFAVVRSACGRPDSRRRYHKRPKIYNLTGLMFFKLQKL